MRVLLDLVPNHTSDRHEWFVDSRSASDSRHRDWYVWADPKPDGSAPNNWVGSFGGPAWTLDPATEQYYLHNFLPEQPDLNWWCDEVRDAFDDIVRFWWDRGVAGFRIDVCNMMVKDAELRDNPPATEDDPFIMQMFGQRPVYNGNRPEAHDVLRRWRAIADGYTPPRLLLGETNVDTLENLASYYGSGDDELHLGFNFPFIEAPFEAGPLSDIVERTQALLPAGAWPVWTGSNHDVSRLATRWCGGDPAKVRLALLMLLTLRGTPVLYQGDEIGLTDGVFDKEQLLDPVGVRFWPHYPGRDPERTPMPWDGGPNAGFTAAGVTPWLALADAPRERGRPARRPRVGAASRARRHRPAPRLARSARRRLPAPARAARGCGCSDAGQGTVVALNLSADAPGDRPCPRGPAPSCSAPAATGRDRPPATRSALGPWEGVVVTSRG